MACAEGSKVDLDAGDRAAIGDIDIAGMQAGNEAADPLIGDRRAVKGDPERFGKAEDDRDDKGRDLAVAAAVRAVSVVAGDPMNQPRKLRRACRTHDVNSAASFRLCHDTPFPLAQKDLRTRSTRITGFGRIGSRVPSARWLARLRGQLRDLARVFIAEKYWEGREGLDVTERMKLQIAGQACRLLLGLEHDYFKRANIIYVFPSTFVRRAHGRWGSCRRSHARTSLRN